MPSPRNCCSSLNVVKLNRSTDCCLPPLPDFKTIPVNISWINNDNGVFPVSTLIEGGPVDNTPAIYSITFSDNNPTFFNNSYYYEVDSTDIIAPSLDLSLTLPADNDEFNNGTVMVEGYSGITFLYGCGIQSPGIYRGFNYIQPDGIYPVIFTYTPGQVLRYVITTTDQTVYLDNQILSYHVGTEFNLPAWKLQFINYGADNTSSSNPFLYNSTTWKIQVAIPPTMLPIKYPPKIVGLIGNCYVRRPDRNNVPESQRMLKEQCTKVTINGKDKTVVAAIPLDISAVAASGAAAASVTTSVARDATLLAFSNNPAMRFNEFLGPLPPAPPCPTPSVNAGVPKPSIIGCGPGSIRPFDP
jgi:hypothetical protein